MILFGTSIRDNSHIIENPPVVSNSGIYSWKLFPLINASWVGLSSGAIEMSSP